MSRARQYTLAASIAWLLLGIFGGIEGLGVAPYVSWRPLAVMTFLGVNALAAATVVAEYCAAVSAAARANRARVFGLAAAVIMLASVLGYVQFMQARVVLGS